MDNKQLNTLLRKEAVSLGICDKVLATWEVNMNDGALISLGYRNIDFLLKHHWPSNQTLKSIWPSDFLRQNGVFVDDRWSVNNPEHSLVLGDSKITIRYNGWNIGKVYVRDNAQISITAKNKSTVFVHAFEDACVCVEQYDDARVVIIRHSENVVVTQHIGMAKVKNELGYLE